MIEIDPDICHDTSNTFNPADLDIVENPGATNVSDVINEALMSDDAKHEKMVMLLREFPMAFEKFLEDNHGVLPHYSTAAPLITLETIIDELVPFEDETEVTFRQILCGIMYAEEMPYERTQVAVRNDLWCSLQNIFCMSVPSKYMPEENEEGETDSGGYRDETKEEDPHTILEDKHVKASVRHIQQIFTFAPTKHPKKLSNSLVFTKHVDVNNVPQLYQDMTEEVVRIFKLISGITRIDGLVFDWVLRAAKNDITIHSCSVPGSDWQAIKSDAIIQCDKRDILALMIDDDRSKEYDETMEGYELIERIDDRTVIRRYYYKPIWPTAARDFILLSTWVELEDGCIIVCTMSPPTRTENESGLFPEKPGFVRACSKISGAYIRPIDVRHGGGCALSLLGHSDPGGSLPSAIVNMLSVGMPLKLLKRIKKILEK